jgi:MraZ protein
MLFTGTFERTVDEKQRLAVPRPLRDALEAAKSQALFIAPGTDGSLAIYTEESFAALADRLAVVSPNAQDVRSFARLFFAKAQRVELDENGRVRIPAELAARAGIDKTVMLVGVRDHLELWDKARWEEYLSQTEPRYDQFAERAFMNPPLGGKSEQR